MTNATVLRQSPARGVDHAELHCVAGGALMLYLGAECGQACSFCAFKSYQPPRDDGEAELEVLLRHARDARSSGIERVRLEGIDPIQFSLILDLVAELNRMGYSDLTVMGTARRFSDPDFRREFLARAPAKVTVVVPIYGMTAEVHDAVSGQPGSFLEARGAAEGLARERGRAKLLLTTVPTPANIDEIAAVFAFGARLGAFVLSRLPYRRRREKPDTYEAVAMRESDIVDAFVAQLPALQRSLRARAAAEFVESIAHPCIIYRAARKPGGSALEPLSDITWKLEGVDAEADPQTQPIATVPCPHAETCGLAARCPCLHYEAYSERFGLDEYEPVEASDLAAHSGRRATSWLEHLRGWLTGRDSTL